MVQNGGQKLSEGKKILILQNKIVSIRAISGSVIKD